MGLVVCDVCFHAYVRSACVYICFIWTHWKYHRNNSFFRKFLSVLDQSIISFLPPINKRSCLSDRPETPSSSFSQECVTISGVCSRVYWLARLSSPSGRAMLESVCTYSPPFAFQPSIPMPWHADSVSQGRELGNALGM